MEAYFEYVINLFNIFWGTNYYKYLFYIALLLICIIEKEKEKRIVFFVYPISVILLLNNPISIKIGEYVWGELGNTVAYFCRQFSLIGIYFVIAYGLTILVAHLSGWKKLLSVLGMGCIICIAGTNIYLQDWYEKAENFYKMPDDVMEICDWITDQNENATIIVPETLTTYIRQYDSNLHLAQSTRYTLNDVAESISSYSPDVILIMYAATVNQCDYVVLNNDETVRTLFSEQLYTPSFETDNYLVYKVIGYAGYKKIYGDDYRVKQLVYHGNDGSIVVSPKGDTIITYEYDENGNIISEHYYTEDGRQIARISGEYGIIKAYDSKNRLIKETFVDINDNPIVNNLGYSIKEISYAENGEICREETY